MGNLLHLGGMPGGSVIATQSISEGQAHKRYDVRRSMPGELLEVTWSHLQGLLVPAPWRGEGPCGQ
jgi:hypothetical protein